MDYWVIKWNMIQSQSTAALLLIGCLAILVLFALYQQSSLARLCFALFKELFYFDIVDW
ncbi:hypothetical protein H4R33_003146 [Dimargaris cristalligena]|nr:hypothetical protein H4R33_003146 [Dimargaris cristalligena]